MMRALVTGSAGFTGSHLTDYLIEPRSWTELVQADAVPTPAALGGC